MIMSLIFFSRMNRYDALRICLGNDMCQELAKLRLFMVSIFMMNAFVLDCF